MTKAEYEIYRQSPHWRAVSRVVRQMRRACENCAFPYELNVHHKTYERLGHEKNSDLIVLCRSCHSREHFVDDFETIPDELFWGSKDLARKRIKEQQKEAREKNLDRAHEIKINRERDD